MRKISFIILVLALGGCSMASGGSAPSLPAQPSAEASLADELARGATLSFDQQEADLSVAARFAHSGGGATVTSLTLHNGEASVVVMPDGSVVLQDLQLEVADIVGTNPDVPIRFTDIEVGLLEAVHADAQWFGGDNEGYAELSADIVINWSLHRGGAPWPLDPLVLRDVPIQLEMVRAANGTPTVELRSSIHGVFYDWVGIAQLSALEMRLESTNVYLD